MKVPKFTVDRAALKKGFWGNTWKNWGYIALAFTLLYAIETGYFTGLLFAAQRIRGRTLYRTLPAQYFGDFESSSIDLAYPISGAPAGALPFNRPDDCADVTADVTYAELNDTFARPTGVQKCTATKDNLAWTLFPWVQDTQAAGAFPACTAADGSTLLTAATSPAFTGDEDAPAAAACQNFVPYTRDDAAKGPAIAAAGGAAGPAAAPRAGR